MSTLELVAIAVYLLSVALANRNSVHTWWTGILGSALYAWVFFEAKLYADLTLQAFFVVTCAVGWHRWLHGGAGRELPVRHAATGLLVLCTGCGLVAGLGYGALLAISTDAALPYFDSIAMAASVVAQLLLMGRRVENWWFWLVANTIYVPLYESRGLRATAIVYVAFWVNAIVAGLRWRRLAAR